jgi:uncharacterized membrane protein
VGPGTNMVPGLSLCWAYRFKSRKESAVFWSALFMLGYAVTAIGAGIILYGPVTTVMGSSPATRHRNAEEDEIWRDLLVTVGVAALWPLTLSLYLASRSASHAVS